MPRDHARQILIIAMLPGLFSSISLSQPLLQQIPEDKQVIQFLSEKWGDVTFLHAKHAGMAGMECITCHHKMEPGHAPRSCHSCHTGEPMGGTPSMIKAFHTRCRGCHQYTMETGRNAGPAQLCQLCHISRE